VSALADASPPPWLLAARVELRRGTILERRRSGSASGIEDEEGVIFAAIEMLRSKGSPERVFLVTERHVHLYELSAVDPVLATVLVAERAANLGLLLPELRRIAEGFAS
jgi:hypothetical protein